MNEKEKNIREAEELDDDMLDEVSGGLFNPSSSEDYSCEFYISGRKIDHPQR